MKKFLISGVLALSVLSGCDDVGVEQSMTTKAQAKGYSFEMIAILSDGTGYSRPVWEITTPDGRKYIAMRGYGIAGDENGGKGNPER